MRVSIATKQINEMRMPVAGDEITVPDEMGRRWCANGWAVDLAGNAKTGKTDGGKLEVKSLKLNTKSEEK